MNSQVKGVEKWGSKVRWWELSKEEHSTQTASAKIQGKER